ncbi:MAG: M23 family metallopeptidase [Chitinophagaceae bacterium]|nr:M23 family metallopeptidase [Chitinophagaceae bacterium]
MKILTSTLLLVSVVFISCGKPLTGVFSKKSPHEAYADDVDNSPEGRQWVAASELALKQPQQVKLPYRHQGYFNTDKPRAIALQFSARQGERIEVLLEKELSTNLPIYADLFRSDGSPVSQVISKDTAWTQFDFDVNETGGYILRLQPELFKGGEYTLAMSIMPSLGFPVQGKVARTGSFWGASRDGGQRSHEGVDIFAPKGTPAIAAEDGYITRVSDGGIGGKTVWLRVAGRNVNLYYAHLDKQLVNEGQQVKKGDVVGLVGNTGNAKSTPSHLHFGVYGMGGPVDPWPFINKSIQKAPVIAKKNLKHQLTLTKQQSTTDGIIVKANTIVIPMAANAEGYLVELPDGKIIRTPFSSAKVVKVEKAQGTVAKGLKV